MAADRREGRERPDPGIVERAAGGDPGAQRALYDRFRPLVQRVARGFAELDADDVDDVVQESFVRAFQNLHRLQDRERVGPWILAIARNRAITRLARRRARAGIEEELSREWEARGEQIAEMPDPEAGIEVELVRRIIAELPDGPEKETVRLFYVEGTLTARDIALRQGVGKSAVTMRLERFRARVKRRLLAEVARLRGNESTREGSEG